jgi:hypothetical protein
MEEKLDFSLPEKKSKNSIDSKLSILLLICLIGLTLVSLFMKSPNKGLLPNKIDSSFSPEQIKELAAKLAQRNLYTRSAEVWQEYISLAGLSNTEHAKALFQIGTLYEKAGMYAEAIEYFYRSEITSKLDDLESQINLHLKDCFERLGKFSALRYELMDRTSFQQEKKAGEKIIAEIGSEKITDSDLNAIIEHTIDIQLSPMTAFMSNEQLNQQKQQMLEQYNTQTAKTQFLQSWLAQEVLYRNALEQELAREPEVKREIEELTRSVLSQQIMNRELADKINITETDLQTYYQANKDKYIEAADEEDPNSSERQKSYDEVRTQVMNELVSKKSQDIQQEYIKQLMDKYDVILHTSALTPEDKNEDEK